MWQAADDIRSEDYLEKNVETLMNDASVVGSTSPVHYEQTDLVATPKRIGDALFEDRRYETRILTYLAFWHANSLFYSLFRKEVLQTAARPIDAYLGFDWSIMMRVASQGPVVRISEGWLERGAAGESSSRNILAASRSRPVHYVLPFYEVSLVAMKLARGFSVGDQLAVLARLAKLNYLATRINLRMLLR
ncbi:MAG: hypothetical protein AAF317_13235, partial [Pseudomonadota bacterium]